MSGRFVKRTLENGTEFPFLRLVFARSIHFSRTGKFAWLVGFLVLRACFLCTQAAAAPAEPVDIFPLEAVEVGQEAVWHTVVSGDEIEEFPLRILGVVNDFLGPDQPGIVAEALDPQNIRSGPVAGMSGSPVYIDGKLVGAYAYGYTWPKEQALIGITPIGQMLPLLNLPETPPAPLQRIPGHARTGFVPDGSDPRPSLAPAQGSAAPGSVRPLPTPLSLSGFTSRTIEQFRDELEALGFAPAASPGGRDASIPLDFRPGAPVAGVVMVGDFNAAATGTITLVEGDRLLAFGHPFLQAGTIALPMAGAEIVTVVRNLQSSFKLANIGTPEGRFVQDRRSGVAGRRGEVPPMAEFVVNVDWVGERSERFQASVWPHPEMVPVMVAMGTLQSLDDALPRELRETITLDGTITLAGGDSIPLQSVQTGSDALLGTAMGVLETLRKVLGNPFGPLEVERVEINLDVTPGWQATALREVRLGDARPRAGQELPVTLQLHDYWGEPRDVEVSVPLPARARPGDELQLIVADAEEANQLLGAGFPAQSADSLEDWLRPVREARAGNALYVFLVAGKGGVEIGGQALRELPPSIRDSLGSSVTNFVEAPVRPRVLWEHQIPLEGTFSGYDRVTLTLE